MWTSLESLNARCAIALLIAAAALAPVRADDDPCAGYKWDLAKERTLYSGTAKPLPAGKDAASAAAIEPNRLYSLELFPAAKVNFPVTPGKSSTSEGSYAGILTLKIPNPGKYRVALDQALWIDIASRGKLLTAVDYEGVHGCNAPRKVVVFSLQGQDRWTVQVSASDQASVRLTVTPAE